MKVNIRKATKNDVDRIMIILGEARQKMGQLGIDQWQYGYPSRDIIKEDVSIGRSYAIREEENGEIYGTFFVEDRGEPTYDKIYDGEWLTGDDAKYIAVHRVAVCNEKRGSGLANSIFAFAEEKCREAGVGSIRIDTHRGNVPMRRFLDKNGFVQCGIIYLGTGEERIAYEKLIK
jgi:GNAT superfamily N-acetyltransferase